MLHRWVSRPGAEKTVQEPGTASSKSYDWFILDVRPYSTAAADLLEMLFQTVKQGWGGCQ